MPRPDIFELFRLASNNNYSTMGLYPENSRLGIQFDSVEMAQHVVDGKEIMAA